MFCTAKLDAIDGKRLADQLVEWNPRNNHIPPKSRWRHNRQTTFLLQPLIEFPSKKGDMPIKARAAAKEAVANQPRAGFNLSDLDIVGRMRPRVPK